MMTDTVQTSTYQQDLSVSTVTILLHAIWMTVVFIVVPLIPFSLIWGREPLLTAFTNSAIIAPALVLVVAHELLHAISWKFAGGLSFRDFKFGIAWKTLSPYCHAMKPMTARAYRFGAIMPGLVLGLLPIAVSTLTGDGFLAVLGALLTAGAVGDVYVLWLLRDVPSSVQVIDHPKRAGCIVLHEQSEN
jgi:Putative zincin peptidase